MWTILVLVGAFVLPLGLSLLVAELRYRQFRGRVHALAEEADRVPHYSFSGRIRLAPAADNRTKRISVEAENELRERSRRG